MRIALDGEWNMAWTRIWVFKTIDIDSGEIRTWYEGNSFRDFIKDATLVVAHNGIASDFKMLLKLWNTKMTMRIFDTLVVSRLLEPSREGGHSLEAWGKRLGTLKTDYAKLWSWMMDRKEEYKGECFDKPVMPLLEHYCHGDVVVLRQLYLHLEGELQRLKFAPESVELEHRVAEIIAEQEENGFKLDVPFATVLLANWRTRLSTLNERAQELYPPVITKRFHRTSGKPLKDSVSVFNMGSRQQVAEKLMELGWEPNKHTDKGSVVVDEAVLEEILK